MTNTSGSPGNIGARQTNCRTADSDSKCRIKGYLGGYITTYIPYLMIGFFGPALVSVHSVGFSCTAKVKIREFFNLGLGRGDWLHTDYYRNLLLAVSSV